MSKYRKAYTLYKRKLTGKRKDKGDTAVWYYQAWDGNRRIPGQSTGKATRGEADSSTAMSC